MPEGAKFSKTVCVYTRKRRNNAIAREKMDRGEIWVAEGEIAWIEEREKRRSRVVREKGGG